MSELLHARIQRAKALGPLEFEVELAQMRRLAWAWNLVARFALVLAALIAGCISLTLVVLIRSRTTLLAADLFVLWTTVAALLALLVPVGWQLLHARRMLIYWRGVRELHHYSY